MVQLSDVPEVTHLWPALSIDFYTEQVSAHVSTAQGPETLRRSTKQRAVAAARVEYGIVRVPDCPLSKPVRQRFWSVEDS